MVRSGRFDLLFHGSEQRVHRPRFSKLPIHIRDL